MVFTNVINPRSHVSRKNEYMTTLVRKGASIGANATIVCGVTLGCYSFVGAGSVVTRDVPDYALVYGSPARVRGWMCQCGEQLTFTHQEGMEKAICQSCGIAYRKHGELVGVQGDAS
jgi:UDP-2-acetamido-3-amino-2,3-dideoxy-glucuronate N-acetyltransferase